MVENTKDNSLTKHNSHNKTKRIWDKGNMENFKAQSDINMEKQSLPILNMRRKNLDEKKEK